MDTQRLSPYQYVSLVVGFQLGTAVLLFVGGGAEKDAWVAIIIGLIEGFLLSLPFLVLSQRFPHMGVSAINDLVWGRHLGKIFTVLFVAYILLLSSLVVSNYFEFIKLYVLNGIPEYPLDTFTGIYLTIAVLFGVEVIGRSISIMTPYTITTIILVTVLSIPYIDLNNLRPVFATPMPKLLMTSHALATFPFAESIAFAAIVPYLNAPKKAIKLTYSGMGIAAFMFISLGFRQIGILGESILFFTTPAFTSSRVINLSGVFSRVEIIVAINLILLGTIKSIILLYAASSTAKEMIGVKSMCIVVIPFTILTMLLNHHNFPSIAHNFVYAEKVSPIFVLPFQFGIPMLTLTIAMLTKKRTDQLAGS